MKTILLIGLPAANSALAQTAPVSPNGPWHGPWEQKIEADAQGVRESRFSIDPSKTYTLAELVDLAESHNPETRVAWERARAQAASLGIARSELYPTLAAAAVAGVHRDEIYFITQFFRQTIGHYQAELHLSYTVFDFGIFLGLLMMWLVFDQLWSAPAAVEMKEQFVSNLRLLAQFAREPSSGNLRIDIERSYALREKINSNFDAVRSSGDGVVLEFGPSREQGLAWRNRIINWQTQLRILFLTRIALWKYRAQLPGFDLPEPVRLEQQVFDQQATTVLDGIADRMEGKSTQETADLEESFRRLQQAARNFQVRHLQNSQAPQLQSFLSLSNRFKELAISLSQQVRLIGA